MLEKVFPNAADFTYRGSRIALWLLGLVLFLKLAIALGSIFNGHYAATVADGIPIDSYTPQGAQAFLSLFASLGLSQFMLGALGVVLLLKYRALVPLFLLLLLAEYVARKGIAAYIPIERNGQAPWAQSTGPCSELWCWRSSCLSVKAIVHGHSLRPIPSLNVGVPRAGAAPRAAVRRLAPFR